MIAAADITATQWGVLSVFILQAFLFAKVWLTDKRKANESHVKSLEKSQDRLYNEIQALQTDMKELRSKFEALQARYEICVSKLAASLTRLELLEEFRTIAANDDPTGKTKDAMPPPPVFSTPNDITKRG